MDRTSVSVDSAGTASTLVAEWAERWRARLVMATLTRVGERELAEEIVQDTFARVLGIVDSDPEALDKVRNPFAWLAGITRNVTRDAQGKVARRRRILRENVPEVRERLHPLPDPNWDVDWLCEHIRDYAERILPEKRLRIVKSTLEGKSDAQIARKEEVARSTVRWHRWEAVKTLRESLVGGVVKEGMDGPAEDG